MSKDFTARMWSFQGQTAKIANLCRVCLGEGIMKAFLLTLLDIKI